MMKKYIAIIMLCLVVLFVELYVLLGTTETRGLTGNSPVITINTSKASAANMIQKDRLLFQELTDYEKLYGRPADLSTQLEADMVYRSSFTELPLDPEDYYSGKYENASAGVNGLNKMPVLTPGKSLGVIKDGFISIKSENGFIPAAKHYFGSGVCWSTSAFGALLDKANTNFKSKYGIDLITYQPGDRGPHSDKYKTYTNGGYGYTILELADGVPAQDYRFTINPEISTNPKLAMLKLKVVMLDTTAHATGSHGQAVAGYLVSNIEF